MSPQVPGEPLLAGGDAEPPDLPAVPAGGARLAAVVPEPVEPAAGAAPAGHRAGGPRSRGPPVLLAGSGQAHARVLALAHPALGARGQYHFMFFSILA